MSKAKTGTHKAAEPQTAVAAVADASAEKGLSVEEARSRARATVLARTWGRYRELLTGPVSEAAVAEADDLAHRLDRSSDDDRAILKVVADLKRKIADQPAAEAAHLAAGRAAGTARAAHKTAKKQEKEADRAARLAWSQTFATAQRLSECREAEGRLARIRDLNPELLTGE